MGMILLLRLWQYAKVWLHGLPALWEELLCFFVRNSTANDDVVAIDPVGWRGDFELGGQLQRVNDAKNLVKVTTGAGGVCDRQLDLLVGTNDEH